jgi:excisionase family DNA binding protein
MASDRKPPPDQRDMMNTREVADYLRIKERKLYDLVRNGEIPCSRIGGKWLFRKQLIDQWMGTHTTYIGADPERRLSPPLVVGSHDPLLDWALRTARCGLGSMPGGSLDGLKRLAAGEAVLAGLHVIDPATGTYNVHVVREALKGEPVVMLRWAEREQGLVIRPEIRELCRISNLADIVRSKRRMVMRQPEAGSQILLEYLLAKDRLSVRGIDREPYAALSETDLGLAIVEGRADVGLAVCAVAKQYKLDFIPLHREQFDVVMRRRDYFEPALQQLFGFAKGPVFEARAARFGGYDISKLGTVVYNGE